MPDHLPDNIDPRALARQALSLRGEVSVSRLQRLPAVVCAVVGNPYADLRFDVDSEGQAYVSGRIEAVVAPRCQRCLSPFELALTAEFRLGIVATEQQAEGLNARYEPLIVDADLLLVDLVEDELLLVLPAFPRHPAGVCRTALTERSNGVVALDTHRPFADLGVLWQRDRPD